MTHHTLRPFLLALAAVIAALAGCTEKPEDPAWSNPLDPDGALGGDPFRVVAIFTQESVLVTWNGLSNTSVAGYEVLHSLQFEGPFNIVGSVEGRGTTTYTHTEFESNRSNFYKVRAVDAVGAASAVTNVAAATLAVPPLLAVGEGGALRTRTLDLTIRADVGETVEVDSEPGFPAPVAADLVDGEAVIGWDFGPASDHGEWKHLYVRALTGGVSGVVRHDSVQVDFTPGIQFHGAPTTLASRTTPLAVADPEGVTRMRFAASRALLAAAAWLPGAATYEGYELSVVGDSQLVLAEFEGDLGLSWIDSVWAVPDSLSGLELVLNGGSGTTAAEEFTVDVDAAASQIRIAATAEELASAPWLTFERSLPWAHDGCDGGTVETVWAQVRNDWFSPDALTGSVVWLPPESLGLTYTGPDTLDGGSTVVLSGVATAGTCTGAVTGVELDAGEGFAAATGLTAWEFTWTAPTPAEVTDVALPWRVSAGEETATGEITVVVRP